MLPEMISNILTGLGFSRSILGYHPYHLFHGKRDLIREFGYPETWDVDSLFELYISDGLARRIVGTLVGYTWKTAPKISPDGDAVSQRMHTTSGLLQAMMEADRRLAFSPYAIIYFGFPGNPESRAPQGTWPTHWHVFDARDCAPVEDSINKDIKSPDFGRYSRFRITTPHGNFSVHSSRVAFVSARDGVPHLRPIAYILLDIFKIAGASSEAFWRNILGGLALEAGEGMQFPKPGTPEYEVLRKQVEEYINGLSRVLMLRGAQARPLPVQVVDGQRQLDMLISLLAAMTGIPQRILVGSERGQLASTQDQENFAEAIDARRKMFAEPNILIPVLDVFARAGLIRPVEKVEWVPITETMTPMDRAKMADLVARAIAMFAGAAANTIMDDEEFRNILTPIVERGK